MTDDIKELLTLAAKACGRSVKFTDSPKGGCYLLDGGEAAGWWAPHLDDGDGARMEAELTISVEWHSYDVAASSICPGPSIRTKEEYADHNNDRQAARRWASLRAAAAIGGGACLETYSHTTQRHERTVQRRATTHSSAVHSDFRLRRIDSRLGW